jgi:hypothetical protein
MSVSLRVADIVGRMLHCPLVAQVTTSHEAATFADTLFVGG